MNEILQTLLLKVETSTGIKHDDKLVSNRHRWKYKSVTHYTSIACWSIPYVENETKKLKHKNWVRSDNCSAKGVPMEAEGNFRTNNLHTLHENTKKRWMVRENSERDSDMRKVRWINRREMAMKTVEWSRKLIQKTDLSRVYPWKRLLSERRIM